MTTDTAKAPKPVIDWAKLRADFPILDQKVHGHPLIYFDNAASSQKPRAVIEALTHYYECDNANVHRGIHELSNRATNAFREASRVRVAKFINARTDHEIIFTRGTTEGINLVAQSWGSKNIKAGDKILLTEMEHHSNIVPWQLLAERTGAKLVYLPITGDEGLLDLSKLDELLTKEVKLFAFTHISNSLGTVNPMAELCERARKLGVTTLVDAAQSAGHLTVDVQKIGCDFLVFSGHKICGPTGIGVLWGREEILNHMPPYQGGGEMILNVDFFKTTYKNAPHRFEAGTPDISGVIALHTALDYLDNIGRDAIFKHDQELAGYAFEQFAQLKNIRLFGPKTGRAGLVSFLLNDVHAHDVVTFADQRGVALRGGHHCNQPLMKKLGVPSTARASFYFYNNKSEVDRFIEVVKEIQKFFGRMKETIESIGAESSMKEVLAAYPGAQRALFRKYHIGGCSSCGFQPTETLAGVCARNGGLNVGEVLEHIKLSHEQDAKVFISPRALAELLQKDKTVKLLDVRSREEFEATHIEGAVLMSQPVVQEIMAKWPRTEAFVIIDHEGKLALDAAAYFLGHGFENVRCLRGGIDAWAQEVDASIRRYQLA